MGEIRLLTTSGNADAKVIQKDKEDLEEISNELELADEDEKVQCVLDVPLNPLPSTRDA